MLEVLKATKEDQMTSAFDSLNLNKNRFMEIVPSKCYIVLQTEQNISEIDIL